MIRMTQYQKRWIVAIMYYADMICLVWIVAAHILSFWNISILDAWAFADIAIISIPVFLASTAHGQNRLYFAHFGENRPFKTIFSFTTEDYRRSAIMVTNMFKYISTAPTAMPYAPHWLVWFGWVLFLTMFPYGYLQMCTSIALPIDVAVARTTILISGLLFYSLPILYSWQRELIMESDA